MVGDNMDKYTDDSLRCLSGLPLYFFKQEIRQYKIKDIIDFGIKEYYDLCFPFLLTVEYFGISDSELKIFDIFWTVKDKINDKYLLEILIEGLSYFLNTDNIQIEIEKKVIKINEKLEVDRNNFEILSEKIRLISSTDLLKVTNNIKEEISNERAKKYLKAREEYNMKKNETESLIKNIYDTISYLVHNQSDLSYETIMSLTMFQVKYSFNILNKKETYKTNLNAHFAGAKLKKKDLKHWLMN